MNVFLASIVVLVALGLIVLLRGRDRRVGSNRLARWLRIAALIPLGLEAAVFVLFGVAEMVGGDLGGGGHLLQLVMLVLLAILAWMRPVEGGVGLAVAGMVSAAQLLAGARGSPEPTMVSPALMIVALPQIISGVLFFIAGVLARR